MRSPLALLLLLVFTFVSVVTVLASVDTLVVSMQTSGEAKEKIVDSLPFVALIVSELLALLPTKSKGLVHYAVIVFRNIFKRSQK